MKPPCRNLLRNLSLATLASAWLGLPALAQQPANPLSPGASAVTFAPETEAKLRDFLEQVRQAKRKRWLARMHKEIEQISKATGITAEETKKLETSAQGAVEICLGGWAVKFEEFFRVQFSERLEQTILMTNPGMIDTYARAELVTSYPRPYQHRVWTEALGQTLTPAQAEAWTGAQAERHRVLSKEVRDFVQPMADQHREQERTQLVARCASVQASLRLPAPRLAQLAALAQSVTEQNAEEWQRRAEMILSLADEEHRSQLIRSGAFTIPSEERELAAQQNGWNEGLAKLLSAEERQRLEQAREAQRARRATILGQILIMEFDEQVAFSARQRQLLEPIAERLVKAQPGLFPELDPIGFGSIRSLTLQSFWLAGAKAQEAELKTILEPVQWKHWQEACKPAPEIAPAANLAFVNLDFPVEGELATEQPDEEEFEQILSDFLFERANRERTRLLTKDLLKIEDAARSAGLPEEATQQLQTAARGAAEQLLASWKLNTELTLRSQLGNSATSQLRQRLLGLAGPENGQFFQLSSGFASETFPTWELIANTQLNEEQRAAWQKALAARKLYRAQVTTSAILTEFDRRHQLTTEQWDRLHPLLAKVLSEHGNAIEMMFGNSRAWYLQNFSMFVPLAGVSEDQLTDILTNEQWKAWAASDEFATSQTYWRNVQQNPGLQNPGQRIRRR